MSDMVKVSYVGVPTGLKTRYGKTLAPLYKTKKSSRRFIGRHIPEHKKSSYRERSYLPQLRQLWTALSSEQQDAWRLAAAAVSQNSWNLFVQDTSYRLKHNIEGIATPSDLHSYLVGHVEIEAPATGFVIEQAHPIEYRQMKKVMGTKSQKTPVTITEFLTLPYILGVSYRANLTAAGANPSIRLYAAITYSYKGQDVVYEHSLDLSLDTDWHREALELSALPGPARGYILRLEFTDVRGTFEFDNLQSQHTGTNYAHDFRCDSIDAGFSNYNYILPPPWVAPDPVAGATFGSVYPADGSL